MRKSKRRLLLQVTLIIVPVFMLMIIGVFQPVL